MTYLESSCIENVELASYDFFSCGCWGKKYLYKFFYIDISQTSPQLYGGFD